MKRHLNSLLQRKRTEFEGARDTRRSPRSNGPDEAATIELKDGYDWLAMIKGAQVSVRAVAHHLTVSLPRIELKNLI